MRNLAGSIVPQGYGAAVLVLPHHGSTALLRRDYGASMVFEFLLQRRIRPLAEIFGF